MSGVERDSGHDLRPSGGPVMVKLGGALLTNKEAPEVLRADVLEQVLGEIARWYLDHPGRLVLAHGSGSFAHVSVIESGFLDHPDDPGAIAAVCDAAARLDRHVVAAALRCGLPAVGVPGGALVRCRGGRVVGARSDIVRDLLRARLIPVTYGDVAPDASSGGCIVSTEPLLAALGLELDASRIILATDVDGVYDADPHTVPDANRIDRISPRDRPDMSTWTSREGVRDVTGGMAGKVDHMLRLVARRPNMEVRILSGFRSGAVIDALEGRRGAGGTRIVADAIAEAEDRHAGDLER